MDVQERIQQVWRVENRDNSGPYMGSSNIFKKLYIQFPEVCDWPGPFEGPKLAALFNDETIKGWFCGFGALTEGSFSYKNWFRGVAARQFLHDQGFHIAQYHCQVQDVKEGLFQVMFRKSHAIRHTVIPCNFV